MLITKTEPVNKTKYAVSIDGEFAFVLYKGELHKYGISENRELAQDVFDEIMEHVLPKRAKLRCMNLLKSREYTRQQMEDKLRQGNAKAADAWKRNCGAKGSTETASKRPCVSFRRRMGFRTRKG